MSSDTSRQEMVSEILAELKKSFTKYPAHELNSCCVKAVRTCLDGVMGLYNSSTSTKIKEEQK